MEGHTNSLDLRHIDGFGNELLLEVGRSADVGDFVLCRKKIGLFRESDVFTEI